MREPNFIYERNEHHDHLNQMSYINGSQRENHEWNPHNFDFQSHKGILYRRSPASVRRLLSTA